MGNIRYQRTARRITSAVNCRPLKGCAGPTEATCRRLAMPGRVAGQCDGTRLQQIPSGEPLLLPLRLVEPLVDRDGGARLALRAEGDQGAGRGSAASPPWPLGRG